MVIAARESSEAADMCAESQNIQSSPGAPASLNSNCIMLGARRTPTLTRSRSVSCLSRGTN